MKTRPAKAVPETIADLLEQLGNISPRRIRLQPPPGKATEKDVVRILDRTNRLFELVDGVLVEKVMGYSEGSLALWLGHLVQGFLDEHDLGNLAGADGTIRLWPRLVRIPDLSFVRWEKLPGRRLPSEPIPDLVPDLAVEVLSEGNTPGEMERKLRDYFQAGITLVWFVDPKSRTISVYTAPDQVVVLTEEDTLNGGAVLPGLALSIKQIFAKTPRPATAKGKRKPPRKRGNHRAGG
jgi:Uma2 family endonuclease